MAVNKALVDKALDKAYDEEKIKKEIEAMLDAAAGKGKKLSKADAAEVLKKALSAIKIK